MRNNDSDYAADPFQRVSLRRGGGKERPGGGGVVTSGFDPIIGQALGNGPRRMDEPYPNYPAGSRRTTLEMPQQFVVLTAAAYFFVPSISALRTMLT
jgi:hypothetical protein